MRAPGAIMQPKRQLFPEIRHRIPVLEPARCNLHELSLLQRDPVRAAEHKAGNLRVCGAHGRVDANAILRQHAQVEVLDALSRHLYRKGADLQARGLRHALPLMIHFAIE